VSRLGSGSLYCTGAALCNQILCCSVDVLNFYALHLNVTSRLSYSRRKESLTYLRTYLLTYLLTLLTYLLTYLLT